MRKINTVLIITLIVSLISTGIFCAATIHQKNRLDHHAIVYLVNVDAYVRTQLLPLADGTTEGEWYAKVAYLQIAGNLLTPGATQYGDYGKVCMVFQQLSNIPYQNFQSALALTRTLRISGNTMDRPYSVIVHEGDIDVVIEGLANLMP